MSAKPDSIASVAIFRKQKVGEVTIDPAASGTVEGAVLRCLADVIDRAEIDRHAGRDDAMDVAHHTQGGAAGPSDTFEFSYGAHRVEVRLGDDCLDG